MLTRIVTWAIVIFLAFYLLTQPQGAANVIADLLGLIKNAGNSIANFTQSL